MNMYKDGLCLTCGSHLMILNTGHIAVHEQTKKHQEALNNVHHIIIKNNNVECPCGAIIKKRSFALHCNSQKHKRYLKFFHKKEIT